MLSVLLTVAFVGLPLVQMRISRSIPATALWLGALLAIFGGLLQTSVGWGVPWTLQSLQWAIVVILALGVFIAWLVQRLSPGIASPAVALGRQFRAIIAPVVVIAGIFLLLRLMAGPTVSPLAGFGFLANHPYAEDNAKWLNLASILVSGRELEYSGGYAGGPYVLVLVVAATVWEALSFVLLGGTNEVAVTTGAVIGGGFLLAALVPFALAPLLLTRKNAKVNVPSPLLWAGMLVLVTASIAVSALGHQSLQLALLMLVLFASVFLASPRGLDERILGAVLAVMAAVVWFPLNLFSVAVLLAAAIWVIACAKRRLSQGRTLPWIPAALVIITAIAAWDGLVSSSLYALGLDGRGEMTASGGPLRGAMVGANTASLFDSPGGTEASTAFLGLAAVATVIAAAIFIQSTGRTSRQMVVSLMPLAGLALYSTLIAMADGILTTEGTNYATQKMIFTVTVVALTTTVPFALMNLNAASTRMTPLRWTGVIAIVFLLTLDSILPRAIGTISPELWRADPDNPPYWTVVEARNTPDQPISELPIACVYLPPGAERPTTQIDGSRAYTCTRLLIGLSGKEGNVGSLMDWIRTDWLANGQYWDDWYANLEGSPADIKAKRLIIFDESSNVIGFDTLEGLLRRYPPPTVSSSD